MELMEIGGKTVGILLRVRKLKITSHMKTQQVSVHSSHASITTRARTSSTQNDTNKSISIDVDVRIV